MAGEAQLVGVGDHLLDPGPVDRVEHVEEVLPVHALPLRHAVREEDHHLGVALEPGQEVDHGELVEPRHLDVLHVGDLEELLLAVEDLP